MELYVVQLENTGSFLFILKTSIVDTCYGDVIANVEVQEEPYSWITTYNEITLVDFPLFDSIQWFDEQCNIKGSTSTINESYAVFLLAEQEVARGTWSAGNEVVSYINNIIIK